MGGHERRGTMNEGNPPTPRRRKSALATAIDCIASIPFGITVLVLILAYSWVGSAGFYPIQAYPARWVEMTEMEWFSWWPFTTLLGVFCVSLVLVTIRRIPFNRFNLGVWTVHAGLLILVSGCVWYFATKVEGDMLVYRHSATITAPGAEPQTIVLRRGERAVLEGGDRRYEVVVSHMQPGYELLTGEHKGKRTFAATFRVRASGGDAEGGERSFFRQVLTGYPQFTEDVEPGRGRAIKFAGTRLLDEALEIALSPAPNGTIFLKNDRALLVRRTGADADPHAWSEWPLDGLPRYHEFGDLTGILGGGEAGPPLDMRPTRTRDDAGVPDDISFRVRGYLPFAMPRIRYVPGGAGETGGPAWLRATIAAGESKQPIELLVGDPQNGSRNLGEMIVRAIRVETPEALDALRQRVEPKVRVRVASKAVDVSLALATMREQEVAVPGTPYRLKLVEYYPDWKLATARHRGKPATLGVFEVRGGPKGDFVRSAITPFREYTHDSRLESDGGEHGTGLIDDAIDLEVVGSGTFTGLTFVTGPVGLHVLVTPQQGDVLARAAAVGETVAFEEAGASVTIDAFSSSTRMLFVPAIMPQALRDPKERDARSMLQLEVRRGDWQETLWLPYAHHTYPSHRDRPQYALFEPVPITPPGGPTFELLFARQRVELPHTVTLDDFGVERYTGEDRVRNYISDVRFHAGDGAEAVPMRVSSNHPAAFDGWWYFQESWDPGEMAYTGLGVGNRNGIFVMLLGSLMVIVGTIFAFYVKPVLIRRHRDRVAARRSATVAGAMLAVALATVGGCSRAPSDAPLSVSPDFVQAVDLDALRLCAVQEGSRVKTIDTLAREAVTKVNVRAARSVDPVVFFFDLLFADEHYRTANVIYIKKGVTRRQIVQRIRAQVPARGRKGSPLNEAELRRMVATGLTSDAFLMTPPVPDILQGLQRDVMRSGKEIGRLHTAHAWSRSQVLAARLRLIPPPAGPETARWLTIDGTSSSGAPMDSDHAKLHASTPTATTGLAPEAEATLRDAWRALRKGWIDQDVGAVNTAAATLAATLPTLRPDRYPSASRLTWEHRYHKYRKLTWAWIFYLAAVCFLLTGIVFAMGWAKRVGVGFFAIGFTLHTASIFVRWYLSGRIPNANLFEAVVGSAWLGCVLAIGLEWLVRRWTLRGLPVFCAAVGGMVAMMFGHFSPIELPSDITMVEPLLDRTVWLYIHTNLVIASYAIIFFGGTSALLYIVLRALYETRMFSASRPGFRKLWLGETGDSPARGGAASLILSGGTASAVAASGGGGGGSTHDMSRAGLAKALDGTTMIFTELGFITLWVGTILGALWADYSWGRPWGWDPKEVFAMNTWIVILILVHVRMRARDKALWTAILAVIGSGVMLFNWWVINTQIVGLHSYA